MTKSIYDQFVHEWRDDQGRTRYAVAEYQDGSYRCRMDATERKLNGGSCFAYLCSTASGLGGYLTRRQALRRARYLYPEVAIMNANEDVDWTDAIAIANDPELTKIYRRRNG
jgi:hypothetical protein